MIDLPGLWQTYSSSTVLFSVGLTGKVCLFALSLHIILGMPAAWYLSGKSTRLKSFLENMVNFPLVFPPIATGYLLLVLFGRSSSLGGFIHKYIGTEIIFSFSGVVIASFIAGLPLVIKPVQSAIKSLGNELAEASYTLGRGKYATFFYITLPCVKKSVFSGLVLGIGRSLGEVGITLMIGGNIIGKTNTLSLEVFNSVYDGDYARAAALCLLLAVLSAILFNIIKKFDT